MDIILGLAILMGIVWFLSRTVSNWFLTAFDEGPASQAEKSGPSKIEVIYPSRRWAEPRRVHSLSRSGASLIHR
jgi:hypothetical protein